MTNRLQSGIGAVRFCSTWPAVVPERDVAGRVHQYVDVTQLLRVDAGEPEQPVAATVPAGPAARQVRQERTRPVTARPSRPAHAVLALEIQTPAPLAARMALQPHGVSSAMSVALISEISARASSRYAAGSTPASLQLITSE